MGIWLRQLDKKLFVNTGYNKFYIDNIKIAEVLFIQFPEIKEKPVYVDTDRIEKVSLTYEAKIVLNTIRNKITCSLHEDTDYIDNVCMAQCCSNKEKFLKKIGIMGSDTMRVVFPSGKGWIVACGSKDDMVILTEKFFNLDVVTHDYLFSLAKRKAQTAVPSIDGCISYSVISNENIMIKTMRYFRKMASYNGSFELSDIKTDDSKAIHTELNELDSFFASIGDYVAEYGFSDYEQIPFKIASFRYYCPDGTVKSVLASGNDPGEVYVRAVKNGFSQLLDKYDMNPCSKNVMAQTKLDVLILGVLPVVFNKLAESSNNVLSSKNICVSDSNDLAAELLFILDKEVSEKDVEISLINIKGTSLKKGVLKYISEIVVTCFGIDEEQIVNSLLRTFYAIFIQNQKKLKHIHTEVGNELDLHGKEEEKFSNIIISDINTAMEHIPGFKLEVYSWKYNSFLEKTKMKCFKVKINKG